MNSRVIIDINDLLDYLATNKKFLFTIVFNDEIKKRDFYKEFSIPKRKGVRKILSPIGSLRTFQKKIKHLIELKIRYSNCSHGYIPNKSIKTNALAHRDSLYFYKVDLKDFFETITEKRIFGALKRHLNIHDDLVLKCLTKLVTVEGSLPQGGVTSPIISNLICNNFDKQITKLCKKFNYTYTRYADDIVISSKSDFRKVDTHNEKKQFINLFAKIIESNEFLLNEAKTAFLNIEKDPVYVTGVRLIEGNLTWRRKRIRVLRSVINDWYKNGLTQSSEKYFEKNQDDYKYKFLCKEYETSKRELNSKLKKYFRDKIIGNLEFLGFIRNYDCVYSKLALKLTQCKGSGYKPKKITDDVKKELRISINIYVEGPSDKIHLETVSESFEKKRFKNLFKEYKINFINLGNDSAIEKYVREYKYDGTNNLHIALLDGDSESSLKKEVRKQDRFYIELSKNLFCLLLPSPDHRTKKDICIEMIYEDSVLKNPFDDGKQIFLREEFDRNHVHREHSHLIYQYPSALGNDCSVTRNSKNILEYYVLDLNVRKYVSREKMNFAHKIKMNKETIDFSPFIQLFLEIEDIIKLANSAKLISK